MSAPQHSTSTNKITVTMSSQIRYEGALYQISAEDKTITLTQVRSFGTEGRRQKTEIPASSIVHDYVIFRGADIIDLKVPGSSTPEPNAVISDETRSKCPQSWSEAQDEEEEAEELKIYPQSRGSRVLFEIEEVENDHEEDNNNSETEGERDYLDQFQISNRKFQHSIGIEFEKTSSEVIYKKANFFDQISPNKSKKLKSDEQQQKKIDSETFGSEFYESETKQRSTNDHHFLNNFGRSRKKSSRYQRKNSNSENCVKKRSEWLDNIGINTRRDGYQKGLRGNQEAKRYTGGYRKGILKADQELKTATTLK